LEIFDVKLIILLTLYFTHEKKLNNLIKYGLINLNKLWLVFFLVAPLLTFSQNKYLNTKKADRLILNSEFDKGIDIYKNILKKDSTYYKANFELANTYYYLGNYDSSIVYYLNCIKFSDLPIYYQ